jgi:hypothetical protein
VNEADIVPKGEALRRAVRWLGEQPEWNVSVVEEAARRFDLSPIDEAFLLREFTHRPSNRGGPSGSTST